MCLKYLHVMILWLLFLGNVLSSPGDEARDFLHEEEHTLNDEAYLKYIVPTQKHSKLQLEDLVDKTSEHYKVLMQNIEAGHTMKGLTFTIYNDNMREAAVALFRLMQSAEQDKINIIKEWAFINVNKDILEYALRLLSLYKDDELNDLEPPFVTKPNFFVNSETIVKALRLKINHGKFDPQEGEVHQIYREDDVITINTNYSEWNKWNDECINELDYFVEDIGLNSYYYGVHILYPFWMSNEELSAMDSNYAVRYYYIHQQLQARYNLENEYLVQQNISNDSKCYDDFKPYLSHENGLTFSSRSSVRAVWNEDFARLKTIDAAIKECIASGLIFIGSMENDTKVDLTEDNYIDLLSKVVRNNYETVRIAKAVRNIFGYGGHGQPYNRYNPATSVIHHPQTTLRDPVYWYMIKTFLKYFTDYANTLGPYDFSKYCSENIDIIDKSFSKLTTYYDYYQISLNKIFDNDIYDLKTSPLIYTARQKRLKHLPFSLAFTVNSKVNTTSLVKLFLGPNCDMANCWKMYSKFFELDSFTQKLDEGLNLIEWSSELSTKYSVDDYYNVELKTPRKNRFDLYKFPENLMIPKGLNEGLNLTLFIIIVPLMNDDTGSSQLNEPPGFPFHRDVLINSTECNNYKFYNVSVHHKENTRETVGYYSPHIN